MKVTFCDSDVSNKINDNFSKQNLTEYLEKLNLIEKTNQIDKINL